MQINDDIRQELQVLAAKIEKTASRIASNESNVDEWITAVEELANAKKTLRLYIDIQIHRHG